MHIVLGITGSIAAYKACELIRLFVKAGHEVQTVITPAGREFITPVTLSALTRKPVITEFFSSRDGSWHSHVDLGLWADAMVVAPATASTLAKMATGVADNMLLTTYLSMKAPVFVAPAMDLDMYAHPATQANLDTLRARGVTVVEPASGELASGLVGKGRMEEPQRIFETVCGAKYNKERARELAGRHVLITAGPTHERIDPVRFLGNHSSGKMGFALAAACARRGARVTLVAGPVGLPTPQGVERIDVVTAADMYDTVTTAFPTCDAAILCAAVADYTVAAPAAQKLKRTADDLTLTLLPTRDIAAAVGRMKREGQVLVGFALETDDGRESARAKLAKKNLDFIVLNTLADPGAGFGTDTNKVTLIANGGERALPLKPKAEVADDIIDELCARFV
ncbi:MAG: bifunctional phosphopantothenoylcysteine decarboxylase/phosphopantothenate--cysteine ligase CoaBC [Bacteroidaceae bacterium]|nr:bifunctional phosphopantothenoylcysteine decarboxylase/phosphopantothenate--cysteine ligase CoaBC [Bacteroidaceae bacterium]